MRVHWLQHVPYEGLGHIESWLAARQAAVTCTRMYAGESLPDVATFDLLVILGGPMSVNDEDELPWLAPEKAFIRRAIDAGRGVLGICLGGQLIASALGAKVGPSPEREVGWWPVTKAPTAGDGEGPRFLFPDAVTCLQWHGESFALPPGAILLAQSPGCPHQAMQLGRRVIGVQFHPEATPGWVREVLSRSPGALLPGRYVMTEADLKADLEAHCHPSNLLVEKILEYLSADRT
jgi:GMP synthase-like glutamine amidotransferase